MVRKILWSLGESKPRDHLTTHKREFGTSVSYPLT